MGLESRNRIQSFDNLKKAVRRGGRVRRGE